MTKACCAGVGTVPAPKRGIWLICNLKPLWVKSSLILYDDDEATREEEGEPLFRVPPFCWACVCSSQLSCVTPCWWWYALFQSHQDAANITWLVQSSLVLDSNDNTMILHLSLCKLSSSSWNISWLQIYIIVFRELPHQQWAYKTHGDEFQGHFASGPMIF